MQRPSDIQQSNASLLLLTLTLASVRCTHSTITASADMRAESTTPTASNGPSNQGVTFPRQDGDATAGRDVFRFETFGDEGFWTDAVRLPQGMMADRITPLKALQLGVQVDMDALDDATRRTLSEQLRADPSGHTSALLNDPAALIILINANALIGMPVKGKRPDGKIDVAHGAKVGVSCALCHTVTDGAVFNMPGGGSIGHRLDGLANHNLDLGAIFASAANSRALFPTLQLSLKANGGKTLGRAPTGLTGQSTEAEVDAYLSNKNYYPVGMFDDTFDGNGDPVHNSPLFRQDLAAPYGSGGSIARLDNFSNLVYTALFDQTELTTKGGRAFLHTLGGAAGDEIADEYVEILKETNVKGYPYVQATPQGNPGDEANPIGLRVDNTKLLDMNAYLVGLPAPRGAQVDARIAARGREVFRTVGCTNCHNVDQGQRVPSFIVPMKTIFPGDNPTVLAQRQPPLNPVMNTPDSLFDDKMAVINASMRGDIRGIAMPLLLDLARKPVFLHDNSVGSLDELLDSKRGVNAPHPFYVSAGQRADVVEFLKGLGTEDPDTRR